MTLIFLYIYNRQVLKHICFSIGSTTTLSTEAEHLQWQDGFSRFYITRGRQLFFIIAIYHKAHQDSSQDERADFNR